MARAGLARRAECGQHRAPPANLEKAPFSKKQAMAWVHTNSPELTSAEAAAAGVGLRAAALSFYAGAQMSRYLASTQAQIPSPNTVPPLSNLSEFPPVDQTPSHATRLPQSGNTAPTNSGENQRGRPAAPLPIEAKRYLNANIMA